MQDDDNRPTVKEMFEYHYNHTSSDKLAIALVFAEILSGNHARPDESIPTKQNVPVGER